MAHITKRNGKWQATYRGPDKRERTKTFARKVDAEQWLSTVTADLVRGDWIDPRLGQLTFGEWTAQWMDTTVNLRASTRARDESYLRTHILPAFGARPLSAITQPEVRAWVAGLSNRKAPATVVKAAQILGKILQGAVDGGLIKTNPYSSIRLPRIEREEMRFLSPDEVARLVDAITPRYRALVLVGAYGGLRIGEMAGLKRSRVDVLRGRIEVAEILVEVSGRLTWGHPKTRAGRRTVTLPRPVVEELAAHLQRWGGNELVFTAPEGGLLRVPAWRQRAWAPAVRTAELVPLRPHDLRHTAVALWIAAGANPLEVSRRAGHTSTSFTLDRYGHIFENSDQALSDRLGALYTSPVPAPTAELRSLRA